MEVGVFKMKYCRVRLCQSKSPHTGDSLRDDVASDCMMKKGERDDKGEIPQKRGNAMQQWAEEDEEIKGVLSK